MCKWKGIGHLFIHLFIIFIGDSRSHFHLPFVFSSPPSSITAQSSPGISWTQGTACHQRQRGRPYHPPSHRCRAQSTLTKMTDGALRLCLLLALQLRCVTLLAIPRDRSATAARRDGSDETKRVGDKPDAMLHLRDLPRGPEVAPHKKAPQFMLDLFNAVSVTDGTPKSQKDILEGNIVRSFEDKGEWSLSNFYLHVRSECLVTM